MDPLSPPARLSPNNLGGFFIQVLPVGLSPKYLWLNSSSGSIFSSEAGGTGWATPVSGVLALFCSWWKRFSMMEFSCSSSQMFGFCSLLFHVSFSFFAYSSLTSLLVLSSSFFLTCSSLSWVELRWVLTICFSCNLFWSCMIVHGPCLLNRSLPYSCTNSFDLCSYAAMHEMCLILFLHSKYMLLRLPNYKITTSGLRKCSTAPPSPPPAWIQSS